MSIKFTSHCAGDIGITIGDHEVVAIAFIRVNIATHMTDGSVSVYNVRAGGYPIVFPNLAEALSAMQDIAHCLEAKDELLLQSEEAELVAKFEQAGFDCLLENKE